jgi:hypothetical protein
MAVNTEYYDDGSIRQIADTSGAIVGYADETTRLVASKFATVARTDTAAKNLFTLPANAQVVDASVWAGTASNAGTTATVSVGKTGSNTFFVNAQDVKGTSGKIRPTALANLNANLSASAATQVVGIYAETGAASNAGGPFTVQIDYIVVNP